ncbi:MAG: hypothetical protein K6B44_01945 [Lachnospiraceae bacterium]|nr:hypothetical protein [Lachnospiraceae bacterium]
MTDKNKTKTVTTMEDNSSAKSTKTDLMKTNIRKYSEDELIEMVNSAEKGKFAVQNPEATFDLDQAKYFLKTEYHRFYLTGLIVPRPCTKDEVFRLIEAADKDAISDAQKASKKASVKESDIRILSYDMSLDTQHPSITISSDTWKKWHTFLEEHHVKKGMVQAYNAMAFELLMEEINSGKLKIVMG